MSQSIYNEVAKLRAKAGVTQEELASCIGVSRQTVVAMEKGNYTPSVLLAMRVAQYFDTKVEDVFKIIK